MIHMRVLPKPAKGSAAKARRAARAAIERRERAAKLAAKERDGWACRIPGCGYAGTTVHAMHLEHAGHGGDPSGLRSSLARHYITGCPAHHTGRRSLHSGHLRAEWGPSGGDGNVYFSARESLHGDWRTLGSSTPDESRLASECC